MGSMRNWMLGAAVVAGGLGLGATTAQAAELGVYGRGPAAYIPPCPGPGYVWIAGYSADGYWVPGRWEFAGVRVDGPFGHYDRGPVAVGRFDRNRGRDFDRDWDRNRDRDGDRDRDQDRFRR